MRISLVLPSYNNANHVQITLKAITAQKFDFNNLEILLVDDGSDVPIEKCVDSFGLPVRFIRKEHSGRSLTRNRGIKEASGDILVFMDSDMIMAPDFLNLHRGYHMRGTADVMLGNICHIHAKYFDEVSNSLQKSGLDYDFLMSLVEADQYLKLTKAIFSDPRKQNLIAWVCCLFSNCSIKKETVERVGGFDENFKGWGLEDIELGYRLYKNGCTFAYSSDITNFHVDHYSDKVMMLTDMAHNLKYFQKKYDDNNVKYYSSFVAGFLSLNGLVDRISGKEPGIEAGEQIFFKPILYSKDKA